MWTGAGDTGERLAVAWTSAWGSVMKAGKALRGEWIWVREEDERKEVKSRRREGKQLDMSDECRDAKTAKASNWREEVGEPTTRSLLSTERALCQAGATMERGTG